MRKIERLAIKYLIIGFGIGILEFFITALQTDIILLLDMHSRAFKIVEFFFRYSYYFTNMIVGVFILVDSLKFVRNKLFIPVLGFISPVFGDCFLLIEKFLILKSIENE